MQCPVCNGDLLMANREGIQIGYCPQCRGVWLNREDLDRLIERSSAERGGRDDSPRGHLGATRFIHGYRPYRYAEDEQSEDYHKRGRNKSSLSDLFDFN